MYTKTYQLYFGWGLKTYFTSRCKGNNYIITGCESYITIQLFQCYNLFNNMYVSLNCTERYTCNFGIFSPSRFFCLYLFLKQGLWHYLNHYHALMQWQYLELLYCHFLHQQSFSSTFLSQHFYDHTDLSLCMVHSNHTILD